MIVQHLLLVRSHTIVLPPTKWNEFEKAAKPKISNSIFFLNEIKERCKFNLQSPIQ